MIETWAKTKPKDVRNRWSAAYKWSILTPGILWFNIYNMRTHTMESKRETNQIQIQKESKQMKCWRREFRKEECDRKNEISKIVLTLYNAITICTVKWNENKNTSNDTHLPHMMLLCYAMPCSSSNMFCLKHNADYIAVIRAQDKHMKRSRDLFNFTLLLWIPIDLKKKERKMLKKTRFSLFLASLSLPRLACVFVQILFFSSIESKHSRKPICLSYQVSDLLCNEHLQETR